MKRILFLTLTLLIIGVSGWTSGQQATGSTTEEDLVELEIWSGNVGFQGIEKGSPVYEYYKELFGVGITQPYVEWNGGAGYEQALNLKIAGGEMPDIFECVYGMETRLIKDGALLELSEPLPTQAPNLWNNVPEDVWNILRTFDSTGNNGLYVTPSYVPFGRTGGLIRKDWLEALNLKMPETQQEYVEVLRRFKTDDPNGNGIADELPTGGRENARWMDHLFAMYGIAMIDGYPKFHVYNGELTFAGVTDNMRDALQFISELYAEGLLDPETLLNTKQKWESKIKANTVGNYFHWVQYVHENLEPMKEIAGIEADFSVLPVIKVPGYDGFYSHVRVMGAKYAVKKDNSEERLAAVFNVLNVYGDEDLWDEFYLGVEGMHHEVVDGVRVRLPDDKANQQARIFEPFNDIGNLDFQIGLMEQNATDEREWAISQGSRNIKELQQYVKYLDSDGMPTSVYVDYPDIQQCTLYFEYASRIIMGDLPISAFDEFVDKWYKTGGDVVTERARAWYGAMLK